MGNVGLAGLGVRKKRRELRTKPEGIAKIRRQEMEKPSTRGKGWGVLGGIRGRPKTKNV